MASVSGAENNSASYPSQSLTTNAPGLKSLQSHIGVQDARIVTFLTSFAITISAMAFRAHQSMSNAITCAVGNRRANPIA